MNIKIYLTWYGKTKKTKTGMVVLHHLRDETKIGSMGFIVEETQINIDTLHIEKKYRGRGYGRLAVMCLQAFAEEVRKPIFLYSTIKSVRFYERLGFRHLHLHENWQDVKVTFMNLNPAKKFCEQCSDDDFVWIPSRLRFIRIYL